MAIVNSHFGLAIQYIVCLIIGFNVQLTHSGDKNQLTGGGGGGGLLSILGGATEQAEPPSPYLRDLTGFWSYNDSTDLSKYEDFDHAKFLERPFQKVGGSAIGKPAASLISADDDTKRQPAASADQLDQAANSLPVFDNDMVTNITAQLGGTAFLHCRVRKLGERSVSWVRRRDWHILTSGVLTYTNDERFQVVHEDNSDDWNLQIKYVQKRDNGTYECQDGNLSPSLFVLVMDEVQYVENGHSTC
ncbi:hypothetical protein LSTR_LSTR015482 [Laodelphax striatellus]|uniref:Ig-like domain-containing protein n=1 Tax=Laodelphax striatellus TaxID=195883 RepID=A0A482XNM9_LAOST|nr:hypothetical protein LSTR_LSTR015482 [Laodelphax striatellus]